MKRMLSLRTWLIAFVLFVTGCASMSAPRGIGDSIAYGYGAVSAVRTTALQLLGRNRITAAQAQTVQDKADKVRAQLDLSLRFYSKFAYCEKTSENKAACQKDLSDTQQQLNFAMALLAELENMLNENNRSVKNGTSNNDSKRYISSGGLTWRNHDPNQSTQSGERVNIASSGGGARGFHRGGVEYYSEFG